MTTTLTEAGSLAGSQGPGRARIRIIEAGQGSSGTYPEATLQEAASNQVFSAGTLMFLDHPAASESSDRPERSVRDLAGRLTEDARFEDGALVAEAEVFAHMRPIIEGLHESIGVSIRAMGDINESGEVTAITEARSVDYVTEAGAGGRVLELVESARTATAEAMSALSNATETPSPLGEVTAQTTPGSPPGDNAPTGHDRQEAPAMSESTETAPDTGALTEAINRAVTEAVEPLKQQLDEVRGENAQLREQSTRDAALRIVRDELAESDLGQASRRRIAETVVAGDLPVTDAGELDADTLRETVREESKRTRAEIAEAIGHTGAVSGIGDLTEHGNDEDEAGIKSLTESFVAAGYDEETAAVMAAGRA